MHRQVVVGLLLLAGLGAVLATGAAPADEAGALTLTPASEYATIEDTTTGPELRVELDRANPEAVTQLESVFTIETTDADEPAAVWIADQPPGVTLTHDGQPLTESNASILRPNETLTVAATLNTTDRGSIGGSFTVQAEPLTPADSAPTVGASTPDLLVRQDDGQWLIEMRDPTDVYDVDELTIDTGETIFSSLVVDPADRTQLRIQSQTPETVEPPAGEPLGAVAVTSSIGSVESATLYWEHPDLLDNASLIAYRQTTAGDWEQLPVTVTNQTETTTQGLIETPGFSTVVLATVDDAAPRADLEADLDPPPTTTPEQSAGVQGATGGVDREPEQPTIEAAGPARWQVSILTAVVLAVGIGLLALRYRDQT